MKLHEVFQATRTKNLRRGDVYATGRRNVNYFKLLQYFNDRYGKPVGAGRHRVGFSKGNVVVKVPKNDMGMMDNEREYRMYRESIQKPKRHRPLARNKLIMIDDIPVLYIEKLDIEPNVYKHGPQPTWADEIDSQQVGVDRKGKWKAYDYAE